MGWFKQYPQTGQVHNPDFNCVEFALIKSQAGLNSYKISVKEWVSKTRSIGIMAKAGRYGGTYAHGRTDPMNCEPNKKGSKLTSLIKGNNPQISQMKADVIRAELEVVARHKGMRQ